MNIMLCSQQFLLIVIVINTFNTQYLTSLTPMINYVHSWELKRGKGKGNIPWMALLCSIWNIRRAKPWRICRLGQNHGAVFQGVDKPKTFLKSKITIQPGFSILECLNLYFVQEKFVQGQFIPSLGYLIFILCQCSSKIFHSKSKMYKMVYISNIFNGMFSIFPVHFNNVSIFKIPLKGFILKNTTPL